MGNSTNKNEAKYQPEYYVEDLINLLNLLMKKLEILDEIEFTSKQKTTIAGALLGISSNFNRFVDKLREWGYMP